LHNYIALLRYDCVILLILSWDGELQWLKMISTRGFE
jgi:hypothetical protein